MNLRRVLSAIGAFAILAIVSALLYWRLATLLEYGTQLAVALTCIAIGLLAWGWTPEIIRWIASPRLSVQPLKPSPEEELREIHVRVQGGDIRTHEARFLFVKIQNTGRRAAQEVHPVYQYRDDLLIFPMSGKTSTTLQSSSTAASFDRECAKSPEAYIFAFLKDTSKFRESLTIYPRGKDTEGQPPQAFALFFTLKDFPLVCIPIDGTRTYKNIPSKFRYYLWLRGRNVQMYWAATYEIDIKDWKTFEIKEIPVGEEED
jgi:hypothetical protein